MATCDDDHDLITFEGEFRLLCPLCAMRTKLTDEKDEQIRDANSRADSYDCDAHDAKEREQDAQAELRRVEQKLESLESEIEELRKSKELNEK